MGFETTKYHNAGFKLLLKHIKIKYPFITEIIPDYAGIKRYGTFLSIDLKFDLEKFYKETGTHPPRHYEEKPYLYELLTEPGAYLTRYTTSEFDNKFGYEYNNAVAKELNAFYSRLPLYMRFSKYEDFSEGDFINIDRHGLGLEFFKKWQDSKEPMDINIGYWIPVFDLSKYYKKED